MTVLTGRSGQLFVNGTRAAKCIGWSLDESRPMLESTTVDVWDRTVVPGRRSGTGTAKLLYDPEDTAADELFDSILLNGISELPITMFLDQATGEGYPVAVHVSSASHAVSRGAAQSRDISFRLSDVGIELEIIGSDKAAIGVTQLYTGAVYGIDGAWTYLWTSSGPVIANPTSQTTNITFDTLGTFTLTLTATLGLTVLTDTHVVEVIDIPLLWVSRTTSLQSASGSRNGVTGMDIANQFVYSLKFIIPDSSVGTSGIRLEKVSYTGNRVATKSITGMNTPFPVVCQPLSNGDILLMHRVNIPFVGNGISWMRVSADTSTIIWQFATNSSAIPNPSHGHYAPSVERYYFYIETSRTFMYIDLGTGTLTAVTMNVTDGATVGGSYGCHMLASGKILFVVAGTGFPATFNLFFIEANPDFRVAGLFAPTRVTQHIFDSATGISTRTNFVETEDDIIACSGSHLLRFNKTDFSYLGGRNTNTGGVEMIFASYSGGVLSIGKDPGGSFGETGMYLSRFRTSDFVFLNGAYLRQAGATGVTTRSTSTSWGAQQSACVDSSLGVFSIFANQGSPSLLNREMTWFGRFSYAAPYSLNYGEDTLNLTIGQTEGATSARNLSTTVSRPWAFTQISPPVVTTDYLIVNETALTFQEYLLA